MTLIDVTDIHLDGVRFRATRRDGRQLDFSQLVTQFIWSDHVNVSGAEVSLLCDGPEKLVNQIGFEGSTAVVSALLPVLPIGQVQHKEIWRGFFEEVVDDQSASGVERSITAYDAGKMLATDEEDYVFRGLTLDKIVGRIARDFEIPLGVVPATGTSLGDLVGRGEALWDLLQKAIQKHYNLTGEAYRILFDQGRLHLRRQGQNESWWVFEVGRSIENARRTRSIANLENKIKLYGNLEEEFDSAKLDSLVENTQSQGVYGIRQRVEYVSAEDEDKIRKVARQRLDANSIPEERVEITGWAVPLLRAGEQVELVDRDLGVSGMFYVESLECTFATDMTQSVAMCVKEPVLPEVFLEDLVVA